MTVDFVTAYPKELTNTAWQKQKSFKDKARSATKTGLGEELVKAEAAWKAIPFKTMVAKNFTPKDVAEAQRNLENAEFVVAHRVENALQVLKAANQKAGATAKNPDLSPRAQAAAKAVETKLMLQREFLKTINLSDFKVAITKVEAAKSGGSALQRVSILRGSGEVGQGQKGIRGTDQTVTVYEITWKTAAGDPKALLQTRLTLRSHFEDDSVFANDMTFVKLSATGKTATFK